MGEGKGAMQLNNVVRYQVVQKVQIITQYPVSNTFSVYFLVIIICKEVLRRKYDYNGYMVSKRAEVKAAFKDIIILFYDLNGKKTLYKIASKKDIKIMLV